MQLKNYNKLIKAGSGALFLFLLFSFVPVKTAQALSISGGSTTLDSVLRGTSYDLTSTIGRALGENGDLSIQVEVEGSGTSAISLSSEAFTIAAAQTHYEYSYSVLPSVTMSNGTYQANISFLLIESGPGLGDLGMEVISGVTKVVNFTVDGGFYSGPGGGPPPMSPPTIPDDPGEDEGEDDDPADPDPSGGYNYPDDDEEEEEEGGEEDEGDDGAGTGEEGGEEETLTGSGDGSGSGDEEDAEVTEPEVIGVPDQEYEETDVSDEEFESVPMPAIDDFVESGDIPAPIIISSSHPEEGVWVSQDQLLLNWQGHEEGDWYRYEINKESNLDYDQILHETQLTSKEYLIDESGYWYFHIFRLRDGQLSGISVYKLAIDAQSPEKFDLGVSSYIDENGVKQFYLSFSTIDQHSGIDYYHVVNGKEHGLAHNPYVLGPLSPGVYSFEVTAFDNVGNTYTESRGFTLVGNWQFPWLFVTLLFIFISWLIVVHYFVRKYLIG